MSNRINGFSTGFSSFFKAIPFIFKNNLWWAFLIPLLLNVILYFVGFSLIDELGNLANLKIEAWLSPDSETAFIHNLTGVLGSLAKIILHIAFFFVFAYFSGYILLIVLSPVFAWLSEKTDTIVNNTTYNFSLKQMMSDVWRGIGIALRNMAYELGLTLLVFIATFIPIIGQIISPLTIFIYFIISSYFYGFSYMDYTCERKKLSVNKSIQLMRKYRGMAIANGLLFSLSLLIPFCGVLLAGFTAIIATVGATLAMNTLPEINPLNTIKTHEN